jgi:proton glutamate symport protein
MKTLVDTQNKKPFAFLLSPISMLIGVIVGVLVGIVRPTWVPFIAPVGDIYLSILKMCIAPILSTAIALNIGRLIQSNLGATYLKKIFFITICMLCAVSLTGIVAAEIFQPGHNLTQATLSKLGAIVNESKYAPDLEVELSKSYTLKEPPSHFLKFIKLMIPENVFEALTKGMNIKILFFSILFGIAVGCLERELSKPFFHIVEVTYLAVSKIVKALMYFLPFGTAGLLAAQVSSVGMEALLAMTSFIAVMIGAYVLLFIIGNMTIAYSSGKSIWESILIMEKPILIALTTQTSIACIPSGLLAMAKGFSLDKQISGLLIPLGFTAFRFGNVLYFAIAGLFIAQLYHITVTADSLLIMFVGSIFAGIATAGTSGILTLTMLSIVVEPLGLPLDAVLVLFIVVDPILDPFRTLCTVHTNLVNTFIVVKDQVSADSEVVELLE